MGALTADQKTHLATLSTDLRFQLAQAEVTRLASLFAGLNESRERVRAALASELPLDVQASLANRFEIARLISAWEASKLHLEVNEKNRAESRLGTQHRLVQQSDNIPGSGGCPGFFKDKDATSPGSVQPAKLPFP